MEPFRIIVDRYVYFMMPEKFEVEEKHFMIKLLLQEVYIDGRKELVSNAIKIYTRSIFESLNDKDVSIIRFYENEL